MTRWGELDGNYDDDWDEEDEEHEPNECHFGFGCELCEKEMA